MKEYVKPEAEYISLQAEEEITTTKEDLLDGEMGLESNTIF